MKAAIHYRRKLRRTTFTYQSEAYQVTQRSVMKHKAAKGIPATHIAVGATLLLLVQTASAAPATYSLNADWSNTLNPHGPWSYNYNGSPISTFMTFWWGQTGWGDNWLGDGAIFLGPSPAGRTDPWGGVVPPAHDWQPSDVILSAVSIPYGGGSKFLNVTWTSPANGTIDITGRAWDAQVFADRDMRWSLTVGGQILAERSSVRGLYRTDSGAQFASNLLGNQTLTGIPVAEGEVVEFLLATQTYYGHFLGLEETIAFTRVPEPGPGVLLAMGLLAYGWSRNRRLPQPRLQTCRS